MVMCDSVRAYFNNKPHCKVTVLPFVYFITKHIIKIISNILKKASHPDNAVHVFVATQCKSRLSKPKILKHKACKDRNSQGQFNILSLYVACETCGIQL